MGKYTWYPLLLPCVNCFQEKEENQREFVFNNSGKSSINRYHGTGGEIMDERRIDETKTKNEYLQGKKKTGKLETNRRKRKQNGTVYIADGEPSGGTDTPYNTPGQRTYLRMRATETTVHALGNRENVTAVPSGAQTYGITRVITEHTLRR